MRPRQMRRHARRMRRYGLEPMVVINTGNELPDLLAVVATRWLWRYRSELTPINLGITLALTALALHSTHPYWWPWLLTATITTAVLLATAGHWIGLPRRSERLYAATVATAAGAWLATATAHGPLAEPLPALLAVGTLVLAVPWWAHRRRRARVLVNRTITAWPALADNIGLPGSRITSAVVDTWGWTGRMALRPGQTFSEALGKLPAIESALRARPGAVRIEPDNRRADRLIMRVLTHDPHAHPIRWRPPQITSITEPIPLGLFEDARPVTALMLRRHVLVGGIVDSGKSDVLNVIVAALSYCRDVVVWGIDLKGGMELRPWAPYLDRLATSPREATGLLADAVAELDTRADQLAANIARVWEPTPARPALVVVIDEYAELTDNAPHAVSYVDSIARRGRAPAVTLIAATHRPTQRAMGGGATRSQMDVRICMRVREKADIDLILGQGAHATGWHAHTLDAPGKFLISAREHTIPRRARAYLIGDRDVAATAARNAPHRPALTPPQAGPHTRPGSEPDPSQHPSDGPHLAHPSPDPHAAPTPEERLWRALLDAPPQGIPVAHLIKLTGKGRTWIYSRLNAWLNAGRAERIDYGRWRAAPQEGRDDCE